MNPLFTIPLKVATYLLNGLAIKLLWAWFVAETFNFPETTFLQATGIGILVRFVGDQYIPRDKKERFKYTIHTLFNPVFAIAVGFAVYFLIHR